MQLTLALAVVCGVVFQALAYEELPDGSVVSVVVNPGKKPKFSLLGKTSDEKHEGDKDRNAGGAELKWPGGIVPYVFDASVKPALKAVIMEGIADFHKYTCIKLVPRTNQPDFVKFLDDQNGCYSYVGNIKRGAAGQALGLQYPGCDSKGTVIHEIMHAIGFGHEQCRPDRDQFINVILDPVPQNMRSNFAKWDGKDSPYNGNTFGFKYDFGSIMHYENSSFGNGQVTMRRKDGKPLITQDEGFGDYDIQKINLYYECKGITAPTGGKTTVGPVPAKTTPGGSIPSVGQPTLPPTFKCAKYVYLSDCSKCTNQGWSVDIAKTCTCKCK